MATGNLHEIEYLVFHNYFVVFGEKLILIYHCLLLSSATVKMDTEENMENARYATNDDTPL